jgi:hypothetical protein
MDLVQNIVVPLVASLIGAGVRHWISEATWSSIRNVASGILAGVDVPTDQAARDALAKATATVNADRLEAEAAKLLKEIRK